MTIGETAMRAAIWVALVLYTAGEFGRLEWRRHALEDGGAARRRSRPWRWLWTIGWAVYVFHVLMAFGVFHDWSHAAAYEFTAEQTEALVGWHWGGGLYVNHLFTAVWLAELLAWQCAPVRYRRRACWIDLSVRVFFAFMIVNGAVVFVAGPQRLLGVALVACLGIGFWKNRR